MRARFEEHLAGCDGCNTYLSRLSGSWPTTRPSALPDNTEVPRGGRSISGPGVTARVDGIRWGDEPYSAWLERDFRSWTRLGAGTATNRRQVS